MPDMVVSFVVKISNANGTLPYWMFKIKNVGGTTARNVKILQYVRFRNTFHHRATTEQSQVITQVGIAPGQEMSVTVAPVSPTVSDLLDAVAAIIQSVENGDANPNNNQWYVAP